MSVEEIRDAVREGDLERARRLRDVVLNRGRVLAGFQWGRAKVEGSTYVDEVLDKVKEARKDSKLIKST